MPLSIDELAEQIVSLAPTEQETLVEKVAAIHFRHGLEDLAQKYRKRLAREGKLNTHAAEVLAELEQVREEIAAHIGILNEKCHSMVASRRASYGPVSATD